MTRLPRPRVVGVNFSCRAGPASPDPPRHPGLGTIHVSGMVGIDASTGELAGSTVREQTRQAVANCERVLAAGGGSLDDVVEVGVLLTDPADFAEMNAAYAELFPTDPPARYVAKLGVSLPRVLVSIRMTAWVGPTRS